MLTKSIAHMAVALLFVASPAFADEFFAVTPSGTAEMVFGGKPQKTIGMLSSKCIDVHWTVISSNSNELVCEAPLNMGQSILGQMLLGNSYSTPPRRFFRFNVAEVSGVSRVQASGWMELQMAFGQIKRTDFSGPEFQNGIMSFLGAAGGKYPVGTTFPNHVMMGVKGDDVRLGKYVGLKVTVVEADSPAAKAGIEVGDIITKIVRKPFKNMNDYLDATAKAAEAQTYQVEFTRGGSSMTAIVDRAFRPAFSEAVVPEAETPAAAPAAAPAPSVADELEKLAKLRTAGILTEAEFEAQKKKLLGQ